MLVLLMSLRIFPLIFAPPMSASVRFYLFFLQFFAGEGVRGRRIFFLFAEFFFSAASAMKKKKKRVVLFFFLFYFFFLLLKKKRRRRERGW